MAQFFGTIGMVKMDKKTKRPKVGPLRALGCRPCCRSLLSLPLLLGGLCCLRQLLTQKRSC